MLVVDDEPAIAGLIRDVLRRRGYYVETHAGGEGALDAVERGGFELVISDYAIPGLNGLEFARRLGDRGCGASVLIVSAFLDSETTDELGAQRNVIGLMRKPFDIFDLAARVDGSFGEAAAGVAAAAPEARGGAPTSGPRVDLGPVLGPGGFH